MPIRIVSKKDGFWRCGVRHSEKPKTYADGTFTPAQLRQLKAEPMLIVDEVPDEAEKQTKSAKGSGKKEGD